MLSTARSIIWVGVLAIGCCGPMLLSAAWAAQKTAANRSTYIDANYGFSLNAPNFSKTRNQTVIPVFFAGPGRLAGLPLGEAEEGFASSVNVKIRPSAITRKDYRELTLKQSRQAGFKVNSDRDVTVSGKDAIRLDYEGQTGRRNLHWLALAVIDKDRLVLITCEATAEEFQVIEPEFNACLDSFRLLSAGWAAQKTAVNRSTYIDANYGFSLNAPNFSKARNQTVMPVFFAGPGEAGFASNVNVIIQLSAITRKDYRESTLKQSRQAGFKVNSDRDVTVSGKDAIRLDYEGQTGRRNLHWLTLAVIDKDRVILITCTATAEEFQVIEPEFNACLDSFRLK